MDDQSFYKILEFFNLSRRGYRKVRSGVKKRLSHHMQRLGSRSILEYLSALGDNPAERGAARELLTVSISRFFRDVRLWDVLGGCILPEIVRGRTSPVRVWSAGCASGEEPYGFRILWNRYGRLSGDPMPALELIATDVNPEVLERARIGLYPSSSLKEAHPSVLEDYFIPQENGFLLRDDIRQGI
ncbi:MAG: CheR family methyltransferase, partial [Acidobacteriota bacterium]